MTSKLTRERLQEIAEDGFLKHGESKELARMVLAAIDSEPVAYSLIFRNMDGVLNNYINTNTTFATREKAEAYGKGGSYEKRSDGRLEWVPNAALDPVVVPLYRHAQQPVVPEVTVGDCPAFIKYDVTEVDEAWSRGFNACLAAVLQAGNTPVIGIDLASGPDRSVEVRYVAPPGYVMVPKEPTSEMQSAGASAIRIETTAVNKLWTGNAVYRAMLAAAPQEVKP